MRCPRRWDNRDILTMKILTEQRGRRCEQRQIDFWIGVDARSKRGKKSVIGTPMESPKKTGLSRIEVLFVRKFLEAMEERER